MHVHGCACAMRCESACACARAGVAAAVPPVSRSAVAVRDARVPTQGARCDGPGAARLGSASLRGHAGRRLAVVGERSLLGFGSRPAGRAVSSCAFLHSGGVLAGPAAVADPSTSCTYQRAFVCSV
jgi:hypothetical protein